MAVFRVNKTADYTVMSNSHLREKEMSLKAKGLLSLMLSLPDTWDYSIQGLCTLSKDGYEGVMNALKELEQYGYLERTRITDGKGHFAGYDYDIFERPHPQTGNPNTEKPSTDNPKSDFPITEKPSTGKPIQINTNSINTDLPITKETNTKEETPISPEAESKRKSAAKILTEAQQALFERFWAVYPRKVAKGSAEKAWKKISPTYELTTTILSSVEMAVKSDHRFRDLQYTPHPATWLNGMEWENSYDETGGNPNGEFRPSTGFRSDF